MNNLAKCKCGSEIKIESWLVKGKLLYRIKCPSCNKYFSNEFSSKEQCAKAWNLKAKSPCSRTLNQQMDVLRVRVAELEEQLEENSSEIKNQEQDLAIANKKAIRLEYDIENSTNAMQALSDLCNSRAYKVMGFKKALDCQIIEYESRGQALYAGLGAPSSIRLIYDLLGKDKPADLPAFEDSRDERCSKTLNQQVKSLKDKCETYADDNAELRVCYVQQNDKIKCLKQEATEANDIIVELKAENEKLSDAYKYAISGLEQISRGFIKAGRSVEFASSIDGINKHIVKCEELINQ